MTTSQRFWKKVGLAPAKACWPWMAAKDEDGYGLFAMPRPRKRNIRAHTFAYIEVIGTPPTGREPHHACHFEGCVNPFHLEWLTRTEHVRVSEHSRSGINARKTRCVKGHEFSSENTYVKPDGERVCRTCKRKWQILYKQKIRKQKVQPSL